MSATASQTAAGELFMSPDVDGARRFFSQESRVMTDKLMTVSDAVTRFVHDGDYFASGGFGMVRTSTAALHEVVRHRRALPHESTTLSYTTSRRVDSDRRES